MHVLNFTYDESVEYLINKVYHVYKLLKDQSLKKTKTDEGRRNKTKHKSRAVWELEL